MTLLIMAVLTTRDSIDYASLLISVILALVGIAGVCLALRTLNAIKEQSSAGKIAAHAAKSSADGLINSERAWILAELGFDQEHGRILFDTSAEGGTSTVACVKLTCRNEGRSPAWIDNVYGHLRPSSSVDVLIPDKSDCGNYGLMGALGAGKERSQSLEFTCSGHDESLNAYVIIEYHDIFGKQRTTTLGYGIQSGGHIHRLDGLPERNINT